eukprot:6925297-Prorocentrum_lima.AAC.1
MESDASTTTQIPRERATRTSAKGGEAMAFAAPAAPAPQVSASSGAPAAGRTTTPGTREDDA